MVFDMEIGLAVGEAAAVFRPFAVFDLIRNLNAVVIQHGTRADLYERILASRIFVDFSKAWPQAKISIHNKISPSETPRPVRAVNG
jgi:hypothetical protein